MKKIVSLCLAILLAVCCLTLSVLAEEKAPIIRVTVSDENGAIVLANEEIILSDADGDGAMTVTDALLLAHEKGAPDGFAWTDAYGEREITSLWGYAGGCYGCFVNGASFYLLTDRIEDGDTVHAFVYRGGEELSDAYSYFSRETVAFEDGTDTLTLYAYTLTEEGNLLSAPLTGAVITVNGEKTGIRTDKEGKFTLRADDLVADRKNVISALYDGMLIVPPVLTVSPTEADMPTGARPTTLLIAFIVFIAAFCAVFVIIHGRKRKQ